MDEQRLDARRRAREGSVDAHDQLAEVDRVEPVDVLARVDGPQRLLLVEVLRQRKLDEEGVDLGVLVVLTDDGEELFLSGRGRKLPPERGDPDLTRVLVLEADIDGAALVVADEDRAEPGRDPTVAEPLHPLGEVALDRFQERVAVEELRGQCRNCLSPVRTMARPSSSARAMFSSSRTEPPGCTTTATPASAAASMPSGKG